jgi:polyisoprenoid-binding protein YceI
MYVHLYYICTIKTKTMKTRNLFLGAAAVAMIAVSCSGGSESHTEKTEATPAAAPAVEAVTWMVDPGASTVRWEGGTAGAQVYSHFGNINIKEGKVTTEGDKIIAGNFVIDMASISPTDENYSEEHPAADLVGHLTTEDFFLIEDYPTATFAVTSMEGDKVMGDLTIKGQTHQEEVMLENATFSEDGSMMKAMGKLTFDRQKYGVAWAHYLKDVVLSDDIALEISLAAKKG